MFDFQLIPKQELHSIIPLLLELDPAQQQDVLAQRLEEMIAQGYQCVGIYTEGELVGISGLWLLTKYYIGRHIEPDNVFIRPQYRGNGVGKQLMAWIYQYAREQGCVASELNCYISNESGQKFWESEGYTAIGYHYQKKLGETS